MPEPYDGWSVPIALATQIEDRRFESTSLESQCGSTCSFGEVSQNSEPPRYQRQSRNHSARSATGQTAIRRLRATWLQTQFLHLEFSMEDDLPYAGLAFWLWCHACTKPIRDRRYAYEALDGVLPLPSNRMLVGTISVSFYDPRGEHPSREGARTQRESESTKAECVDLFSSGSTIFPLPQANIGPPIYSRDFVQPCRKWWK